MKITQGIALAAAAAMSLATLAACGSEHRARRGNAR